MDESEKRQAQKALREKYLRAAKRQYLTDADCVLRVSDNVHVMQDGGAWIDAQIWVPKEAIE